MWAWAAKKIAGFAMPSITTWIVGIAIGAVALIIGLGYWHYTGLLKKVSVLEANNAKLTVAVELQDDTISKQQTAIGEWKTAQETLVARVGELQKVAISAATETERLNGIFARHNLTELSAGKPGLVERRINSGTARAFRLLECASGAIHPDCPDADRQAD